MYAKKIDKPLELVKQTIAQFYPKDVLQTDQMADMPGILRDAVKLKYLARAAHPCTGHRAGADAAAVGASFPFPRHRRAWPGDPDIGARPCHMIGVAGTSRAMTLRECSPFYWIASHRQQCTPSRCRDEPRRNS